MNAVTMTDDGERAEAFLPPTTFDSGTNRIKGTDGEWYDVPEPVLVRYMVALGMSSQRGQPPKLVRSNTEDGPTTEASPENLSLLLTDALLSQVSLYMEDGDITALVDLIELVYALGEHRGITRPTMMAAVAEARLTWGGFDGLLLMPRQEA